MYELMVRDHFDAAHSLRDYEGRCASLHGHTWRVDVTFLGEKTDELGMSSDFQLLKKYVREAIAPLEHAHLNEVAPFDKTNPTAENIADFIYGRVKEQIRSLPLKVDRVRVWESETSCVTYWED